MLSRAYQVFVVALWLGSMTWLVVEKVLPPLVGGDPPDYDAVLFQAEPVPDCWRITWQERSIGLAASQVFPDPSGARELRNAVRFEDVPLEAVLAQVLGPWAKFFQLGRDSELRITADIGTRVWFDALGTLSGFQTNLVIRDSPAVFLVRGQVTDAGKLDVAAYVGNASSGEATGGNPVFRQTIDLPPRALVADAFTPRGNLRDLRLGQSWTIPVYRPFPPNSPVQIVAVKAERHDMIFWDGNDVETLLLTYRLDAGSGIRSSREPVAREWVHPDGRVLRQEISISGLRLYFERVQPEMYDPRQELLDLRQRPELWGPHLMASAR